MNNSSYKQAVREGLIPPRVQQVVYQTRDKITRNATMEAFRALDEIDLNGQSVSSYLKKRDRHRNRGKAIEPAGRGAVY